MEKPVNKLTTGRKNVFYKFRFEIIIFLFLALQFALFFPQKRWVSPLIIAEYVKSYEFGFGPKMLLGTIVGIFTKSFTVDAFMITAEISYAVMIIVISLILGGILRKSETDTTKTLIIFSALFLASPFGVKYLLGTYIGRVDVYWIIFTLLSLKLISNKTFRWTVPLFCIIMMAIHHGYMTTYMPALAIPVLYEIYKSENKKSSIIFAAVTYATLSITFLYFQFFKLELPFAGAEEYTAYLSGKTDAIISTTQIYLDYFVPSIKDSLKYSIPSIKVFAVKFLISYGIMNLPLFIVFYVIWIKSLKKSESKFLKFILIICMLAPLIFIPSAMLGVDWDRWLASVINTQFIIIFYLFARKEETVLSSAKQIADLLCKNKIFLLLLLIYMASFSYSTASFLFFKMIDSKHHTEYFEKILKDFTPFSQNAIGTYYM